MNAQFAEGLMVNVGWAIVEVSKVPPGQFVLHEYVNGSPSGSVDPLPSNATVVAAPAHSAV
jgi:hypothetical protein